MQSISLFLKFLGQNFHVTPSELFINPSYQNQYDFVKVKSFETGKKHPAATICIFENRQQDILNVTPNIHTY